MNGGGKRSAVVDLGSAYAASAARIGAWVVVSALVFRQLGADAFAILALARGTIGLLSYLSAGLSPAMIRLLAGAAIPAPVASLPGAESGGGILAYASPPPALGERQAYSSGWAIASAGAALAALLTAAYAWSFTIIHLVPPALAGAIVPMVLLLGAGAILRLLSEPAGAVLQVRRRIAWDNACIASADAMWAALCVGMIRPALSLERVALAFAASGALLLVGRRWLADRQIGQPRLRDASAVTVSALLQFGLLVMLAQLADFFYAPAHYIVINRLLAPADLAAYAPGVQIVSGLLLLVGGIASIILPRAALAHASGDWKQVRRYYVRGTLLSIAVLSLAGVAVWWAGPWLLQAWLGRPMPRTESILPLMLLGAVAGGAGAVGSAILLAIGQARAHTMSVIVAAVTNVFLGLLFTVTLKMGLAGIVLGSVVATAARSLLWLPWYILIHSARNR